MLTERQRRFVDAYQGNGRAAARAAGYTGNDATLDVRASKLLRHPEVARALEDRQTAVVAAADVPDAPQLDVQHSAFVDAYLASDGNAVKAARAIGYRGRQAAEVGARLVRRADVQAALDAARAREEAAAIAGNREQQVILSAIARGERKGDPIKAIATLAKIQGPPRPSAAASAPARLPPFITLGPSPRGPATTQETQPCTTPTTTTATSPTPTTRTTTH